ncbi:type II secretion system F family protein [Ruania alkalisoli]|uniref:Type II secretion system F family protein n=1 Tax=Ruania alkalisoli TaxID=2779775 RepID=A0A7M1SWB5_9MICO|nr:type II secretion system F family protein [Ruania alkalisoli]QOR71859.1 type II secretion system F family protein [Ruania alkalisoli]
MGTVAGLLLGAGLLCIWWSCWPREQRSPSARTSRAQDLLVQAGMPGVSPGGLVAVSVALALVVLGVVYVLTTSLPIAAAFAVLAGLGPQAYVRARARRRRVALRELWPDVVDDLSSAIRAGMSLPEALISLADRGPEQLRGEFTSFAEDYRATGRFTDSLDRLKARLADPVADRLIEALRLTREVGGTDLGRLLRTLSQFLREDLRARGELEARQSWTVNGARLAAASPWLILAMLSTRPQTTDAFSSPAGAMVLLLGGLACAGAYLLMVRIGRLPEDERVMR